MIANSKGKVFDMARLPHLLPVIALLAFAAIPASTGQLPAGDGSCIVSAGTAVRANHPSEPSSPLAVESRVLDRAASAPGDLTIGPRGLFLYLY